MILLDKKSELFLKYFGFKMLLILSNLRVLLIQDSLTLYKDMLYLA